MSVFDHKSLDEQHELLLDECNAENIRQSNPMNLPDGFFSVESLSGKYVREDFYCPRCKIHVKGTNLMPQGVKHCGKTETPKVGFVAMVKSLGVKSYTWVDKKIL
jgi:hypothetical protein